MQNLVFSKVIEEKPFGVGSSLPPPLVQEGLNHLQNQSVQDFNTLHFKSQVYL